MISMSDITTDAEFEALIPPLSDEERFELMTSIGREGFRDPLVVWLHHGILLDGHHRYEIWKSSFQGDPDKEPSIVEMKFADRDAAKSWIIRNQLGRRNLTDAQRIKLALLLKPAIQEKAKENQRTAGKALLPKKAKALDTRTEIAKLAGVASDTVRKYEKLSQSASPELLAAVDRGEKKIGTAFREVSPRTEKSCGMRLAKQAVKVLSRIPEDDAERYEAFQFVRDWVAEHFPAE